MPMKNFTQNYSLKNQLNVEESPEEKGYQSPSKQSVKIILAYSKSLEAHRSKYTDEVLLNLN